MQRFIIILLVLLSFTLATELNGYQNQKNRKHTNRTKSDSSKVVADTAKNKCCTKNSSKCDIFIDEDGDGINDNRCRGYGVCKHKNRHRTKNKSK